MHLQLHVRQERDQDVHPPPAEVQQPLGVSVVLPPVAGHVQDARPPAVPPPQRVRPGAPPAESADLRRPRVPAAPHPVRVLDVLPRVLEQQLERGVWRVSGHPAQVVALREERLRRLRVRPRRAPRRRPWGRGRNSGAVGVVCVAVLGVRLAPWGGGRDPGGGEPLSLFPPSPSLRGERGPPSSPPPFPPSSPNPSLDPI